MFIQLVNDTVTGNITYKCHTFATITCFSLASCKVSERCEGCISSSCMERCIVEHKVPDVSIRVVY